MTHPTKPCAQHSGDSKPGAVGAVRKTGAHSPSGPLVVPPVRFFEDEEQESATSVARDDFVVVHEGTTIRHHIARECGYRRSVKASFFWHSAAKVQLAN
jgi:hypothetical protein